MSRDFYYLNNYSKRGDMGISHKAFTTIVETATNNVTGAAVVNKRKKNVLFQMKNPVKVTFRKDGKLDILLDVSVKKGASVEKVCSDIQNNVADALMMMCETIPFNIRIKVSSII